MHCTSRREGPWSRPEGQPAHPHGVVHTGVGRDDDAGGVAVVEREVGPVDPEREKRPRVALQCWSSVDHRYAVGRSSSETHAGLKPVVGERAQPPPLVGNVVDEPGQGGERGPPCAGRGGAVGVVQQHGAAAAWCQPCTATSCPAATSSRVRLVARDTIWPRRKNVARTRSCSNSVNAGVDCGSGPSSKVNATWSGRPWPDRAGSRARRSGPMLVNAGAACTAATAAPTPTARAPGRPSGRAARRTALTTGPARLGPAGPGGGDHGGGIRVAHVLLWYSSVSDWCARARKSARRRPDRCTRDCRRSRAAAATSSARR